MSAARPFEIGLFTFGEITANLAVTPRLSGPRITVDEWVYATNCFGQSRLHCDEQHVASNA